jgi:CheY-like chemotaxis protein
LARKILLADDSVTAQNMGRKILADAGYEVITVNNGSAALKKIAEIKPDLIVLDVYMPGYSGLEVCQRVKDSPDTSRIPVLLTVGKLEPFKPEEARRVRAEGFIVKPFEASELLSALSKLEDKIVPRGEASKSGRFARAIAAVEENSQYDKNAGTDEDSGWKSRIGFPVKKKAPEPEPEASDSEIYNPMNRDLRTVVESESTSKLQEAKPEVVAAAEQADRVDLSALGAPGLPKDVTSEEIAALAAAAAQMKSKIAETSESTNVVSAPAPAQAAPYTGPERRAEKIAELEEAKREAAAPRNVEAEAPAQVASTQPVKEKVDTPQKNVEDEKVMAVPTPTTAEVMEAIASLERADATQPVAQESGSQNLAVQSLASQNTNEEPVDLPVTMAAGVGASVSGGESRWMAIPVAVATDEAATSLDQEMQKAQAAFGAAKSVQAESFATVPETPAVESVAAVSAAIEKPSAAASPLPIQQVEPLPSHPLELPSTVAEAAHAVVKQFETVATAPVPDAPAPVESTVAITPLTEQEPQPVAITPQPVEARVEESPASQVETKFEAQIATSNPETKTPEQKAVEQKDPELAAATGIAPDVPAPVEEVSETSKSDIATQLSAHESVADASAASKSFVQETSAPETSASKVLATESSVEESSAKSPAVATERHEPIPGGEMAKKESEIAATTAAAWASWRQIRETGDPRAKSPEAAKSSQAEDEEESEEPRDAAAMAVAAGAENRPTEATEETEADPDAIASIVDSVLAQMRPKIVEEISRKMGKKK